MGNTISNFLAGDVHVRHSNTTETRRKTTQPVPDFSGKNIEWTIWKTQLRASLHASNTLRIIDIPRYQDRAENSDDKVFIFGILQSTCAKGSTRHVVNTHEENVNSFQAHGDSCDWCEGSENAENNANQLRVPSII